jgi:hypothetical protein
VLLALAVITLAYVATTEIAKDIANRHRGGAGPDRTLPRAEPAAAAG